MLPSRREAQNSAWQGGGIPTQTWTDCRTMGWPEDHIHPQEDSLGHIGEQGSDRVLRGRCGGGTKC